MDLDHNDADEEIKHLENGIEELDVGQEMLIMQHEQLLKDQNNSKDDETDRLIRKNRYKVDTMQVILKSKQDELEKLHIVGDARIAAITSGTPNQLKNLPNKELDPNDDKAVRSKAAELEKEIHLLENEECVNLAQYERLINKSNANTRLKKQECEHDLALVGRLLASKRAELKSLCPAIDNAAIELGDLGTEDQPMVVDEGGPRGWAGFTAEQTTAWPDLRASPPPLLSGDNGMMSGLVPTDCLTEEEQLQLAIKRSIEDAAGCYTSNGRLSKKKSLSPVVEECESSAGEKEEYKPKTIIKECMLWVRENEDPRLLYDNWDEVMGTVEDGGGEDA